MEQDEYSADRLSGEIQGRRDGLIRALDAFCATELITWGDRITAKREEMGESVSWAFYLDDVELGRVAVTPDSNDPARPVKAEVMTATARGAAVSMDSQGDLKHIPEAERERTLLMGQILRALDRHIALRMGQRKPGAAVRRGLTFWQGTEKRMPATEGETDAPAPVVIRGTVDHFRALMERLALLHRKDGWASTSGERLGFWEVRKKSRELVAVGPDQAPSVQIRRKDGSTYPRPRPQKHYRDVDITPPTRGTWRVSKRGGNGGAGIEVYGQPDGTVRLDFLDGYAPGLAVANGFPPIGPAFDEFTQMVIEEARGMVKPIPDASLRDDASYSAAICFKTAAEEPKKPRGKNIDTATKVAKARLIREWRQVNQQTACDLAGTTPKTFRKYHNDPDVLAEMERLRQDEDFQEEIKGI